MKPKLLKAFTGSLNIDELTLSHHLEGSPITAPGSKEGITPINARKTYKSMNPVLIVKAIGNALSCQLGLSTILSSIN
jgi:hypothetical protein